MTVRVKIIKTRPNVKTPFKDPNQGLNHPTWDGYLDFESIYLTEDGLTETIVHEFENRNFFENPILNSNQLLVKKQSEDWIKNNNISVKIQIIEE